MKSLLRRTARAARLGSLAPLEVTLRVYGGTDKFTHGYGEAYQRHLRPKRWQRNQILEIGVGGYGRSDIGGDSLRVWRDYFPRSRVVGLDIEEKTIELGRRVKLVRGDQTSESDLLRTVAELDGPPTIVIDDGSHRIGHAIASFEVLFPLLAPGGVYIVEDLQTSFSHHWGGQIPPAASTAVGLARDLVEAVQVEDPTFDRQPDWGPKPDHWIRGACALHTYPGMFVVEKCR